MLPMTLAMAVVLPGCSIFFPKPSGPKDRQEAPAVAYNQFREHIRNRKYDKAYALFSKDTQERYKYWEFSMMMSSSRFGQLLLGFLGSWTVGEVRTAPDGKQAHVEISDPKRGDLRKKVEMVYEEESKSWRLRFTLAWALGMPESDERYLFPESFGDPPPPWRQGPSREESGRPR
ncbi:MAG: hypothetical protein HYY93_14490 [Planctomycetes bacterium]|nr:hypothetical protein [Planctomycetota bacterium]